MRAGQMVSRRVHIPEIRGSIPRPASNYKMPAMSNESVQRRSGYGPSVLCFSWDDRGTGLQATVRVDACRPTFYGRVHHRKMAILPLVQ